MTTHVVHLLKHLMPAGTEKKLYHLIRAFGDADTRHTVITFGSNKTLAGDFERLPNTDLIMLGTSDSTSIKGIAKGAKALLPVACKLGRIDIAHAWNEDMFPMLLPLHAVSRIKGNVMSVDGSYIFKPYNETALAYKALTTVMRNFAAVTNTAVVTLSPDMKDGLMSHGYKERLIKVIMNGVDVDHFSPMAGASESLKEELGIPEGSHIIGMASRHTPGAIGCDKDIPTFIRAAAVLERKFPALFAKTHFVICGNDTDKGDLRELAASLGIGDRVHILGPRNDMVRQYSAWDVSNMCSVREPFGLVAAESMACKTPMVVTNVDLLPHIVGNTGIVVPVRAPDARAEAWAKLLTMPDHQKQVLGDLARNRTCTHFDNARMSREFADVYEDLLGRAPKQPALVKAAMPTGYNHL